MNLQLKNILILSLFVTAVSCGTSDKKAATPDLKKIAADSIANLKKLFPANTGWEMLPGDSANNFILATKDAYMLCADLKEDSVKGKYKEVYVLAAKLTASDSIAMRKTQDSVTKLSLALSDKIANSTDQKEIAAYNAEDDKLGKICPQMPAFSTDQFSVYIYTPGNHLCHEEKTDTEHELLQEAIRNYFLTGKFSFEELLKIRTEGEMRMKQIE